MKMGVMKDMTLKYYYMLAQYTNWNIEFVDSVL